MHFIVWRCPVEIAIQVLYVAIERGERSVDQVSHASIPPSNDLNSPTTIFLICSSVCFSSLGRLVGLFQPREQFGVNLLGITDPHTMGDHDTPCPS